MVGIFNTLPISYKRKLHFDFSNIIAASELSLKKMINIRWHYMWSIEKLNMVIENMLLRVVITKKDVPKGTSTYLLDVGFIPGKPSGPSSTARNNSIILLLQN